MERIETQGEFELALDGLVHAHTSMDREEIGKRLIEAIQGHPNQDAIEPLLLDVSQKSHNLYSRRETVAEIKRLAQVEPPKLDPETAAALLAMELPHGALVRAHASLTEAQAALQE